LFSKSWPFSETPIWHVGNALINAMEILMGLITDVLSRIGAQQLATFSG